MGYGDSFGLFKYTSDNGSDYTVRLSAGTASAGGFTAWTGLIVPWPYHENKMRHVTGVAAGNKSGRLPCATAAAASAVLTAGSWTNVHGQSFSTRGYHGEWRDARNT